MYACVYIYNIHVYINYNIYKLQSNASVNNNTNADIENKRQPIVYKNKDSLCHSYSFFSKHWPHVLAARQR